MLPNGLATPPHCAFLFESINQYSANLVRGRNASDGSIGEKKRFPENSRSYKYGRWMHTLCAHNLEKKLDQTQICKF